MGLKIGGVEMKMNKNITKLIAGLTLSILCINPASASSTKDLITPNITKDDLASFDMLNRDYKNLQWGNTAIDTTKAQEVSKGKGVKVAVIDTGVDGTHPDLINRVLAGYSIVDKTVIPAGSNSDTGMHGTHVSGIIGGNSNGKGITGVAPEVYIIPVKVLDSNGQGSDEWVAAGIDWAVKAGADIINLSLGGTVNPFANSGSKSCQAVNDAYDANVLVVVAAGNEGSYGNPQSEPASCRGALSVAAVNENLTRSFFSSYDATVAIAAPGSNIISSTPTYNYTPYDVWDGTSMAAPFVTGVAALIKSKYPTYSAAQIRAKIISSAYDIGSKGRDPLTGYGLVNAAKAVGATPTSLAKIRSSIAKNLFPVVKSANWDGKNTSITWKNPVLNTAKSYTIKASIGDWTKIENLTPKCLEVIEPIRLLEVKTPAGISLSSDDEVIFDQAQTQASKLCEAGEYNLLKFNEFIGWRTNSTGSPKGVYSQTEVKGNTLTGKVKISLYPYGKIILVAHYGTYSLTSPIFSNIESTEPPAKVDPTSVNDLSAIWTEKGIQVSYHTSGPGTPLQLVANDVESSWITINTLDQNSTTFLIELPDSSTVRNHTSNITLSTYDGSKSIYLEPQFPLSLSYGFSGDGYIYFRGKSTQSCIKDKIGCMGDTVKFIDLDTDQVLGTTLIWDNLTFEVDFTSDQYLGKNIIAEINSKTKSNNVKVTK